MTSMQGTSLWRLGGARGIVVGEGVSEEGAIFCAGVVREEAPGECRVRGAGARGRIGACAEDAVKVAFEQDAFD